MNTQEITSRANSRLKDARAVRDGKDATRVFIEGLRLGEEALRSPIEIESVFYEERLTRSERGSRLLDHVSRKASEIYVCGKPAFDSIAETKSPQGIILIGKRPTTSQQAFVTSLKPNPIILLLDRVSNPSNAGAMARSAEAAGIAGIITTEGSSDMLSAAALRSSMGSVLRVPLWLRVTFEEVISYCRSSGILTIGCTAGASTPYHELDWRRPCCILMGSEATGLDENQLALLDLSASIPMQSCVESLNIAVAASIVMYEAARQRGFR
jgi:TrmH family RNA methyltransferase